jgi:hypothetical protein
MGVKLGLSVLREERGLSVFENNVLSRMFGPKKEEVAGSWMKLCNEDPHNLYSSSNIIWVTKQDRRKVTRLVACLLDMRNTYSILFGKLC